MLYPDELQGHAPLLAIALITVFGLQSCSGGQIRDSASKWPVAAYRFDSYGPDFVLVDVPTLEEVTSQIGPQSRNGIQLTQYSNPLDLDRRQLILAFFDLSDSDSFLACKFDGGVTWARTQATLRIRDVRLFFDDSIAVLTWETKGSDLSSSSVALGYSGLADTVCRWSLDKSRKPISIEAFEFHVLDYAQLTDGFQLGGDILLTGWRSQQVVIPAHFLRHLDRIRVARHVLSAFQNDMEFELGTRCSNDAVLDGSKLTEKIVRDWSSQHLVGGMLPQFNIFSEQITFQQFTDPAIISEGHVIRSEGGVYDLGKIEIRLVMIKDVSNH